MQAKIKYHKINNEYENIMLVIVYTIFEKGLILWLLR